MATLLKLGTRGSPLAMTQAKMVAEALCAAHGWREDAVVIVPIKTTGDLVQDRPLADIGGKALWTKELEQALGDGRIDLAVHSMKDVETVRPDSLLLAAMLPRADVRDRLVTDLGDSIDGLPQGARLGTSSPRRAAQARRIRPDLVIVPLRGNVDTRLSKLKTGEADATMLAAAGLDRLGRPDVGCAVPIDVMLPAPAQGAVGIEVPKGNAEAVLRVTAIDHLPTSRAVRAERALLLALGGTCHTPVAALAVENGDGWWLRGEILSPDGRECVSGERRATAAALDAAAQDLGAELLHRASPALRALFAG
jgi:hydroxymethylbilane synthase